MRSNSFNRCAVTICSASLIGGCAAPAPDLPRHTARTQETGYTAPTLSPIASQTLPSSGAIGEPAPSGKKIAMITRSVWDQLSADERQAIEASHELKLIEPTAYGIVIDVQGVDQSTPGTNSGAALGGAVASAAYIDRALSGNHSYSAGANLAIGLLGAVLGSAMDKAPSSQFQFRYTIKQGDGEIQYFDEVKSTNFRHSVGVCVLVPALTLVSQQVCAQTLESVRSRFIVS